jgi:hypothetical protein
MWIIAHIASFTIIKTAQSDLSMSIARIGSANETRDHRIRPM